MERLREVPFAGAALFALMLLPNIILPALLLPSVLHPRGGLDPQLNLEPRADP